MNPAEVYEPAIALALEQYAAALSEGNLEAVVSAWALPALVIGDAESHAVHSALDIRAFFERAIASYRAQGQVTTHAHLRGMEALGAGVFWVDTRWPAFDANGHEIHSERVRYLMRVDDAGRARIQVAVTISA